MKVNCMKTNVPLFLTLLSLTFIVRSDKEYTLELSQAIKKYDATYKLKLKIPVAGDKNYEFVVKEGTIVSITGDQAELQDDKIVINASSMCRKRRLKKAFGILGAIGATAGTGVVTYYYIAPQVWAQIGPSVKSAVTSVGGHIETVSSALEPTAKLLESIGIIAGATYAAAETAESIAALKKESDNKIEIQLTEQQLEKLSKELPEQDLKQIEQLAEQEILKKQESSGPTVAVFFGFRDGIAEITCIDGFFKNKKAKCNYDECDFNEFILGTKERTVIITKE